MKVAVYGATGFTGGLVVQRLLADDVSVRAIGRDQARLDKFAADKDGLETIAAPLHEAGKLREAIDGCDIVVNAAGPYSRLGTGVIEACLDRKVHYVDTCGEQDYLKATFERFDSLAKQAGIAVVNGLAFEVALADWAAAICADEADSSIETLEVMYLLRGSKPTQGTLLSIVEALSRDGWVWRHGIWDPIAPGASRKHYTWNEANLTGISFPGGEVISIPRHVNVDFVQTYVSLSESSLVNRGLGYFGRVLPFFAQTPAFASARSIIFRKRRLPTDNERDHITFCIGIEAKGAQTTEVQLRGKDIYGISAEIIAVALAQGPKDVVGVVPPARFVDPKRAMNALQTNEWLTCDVRKTE